ncbi:hypothetical protein BJY01DRAFT_251601 [Aspergillus pseudoustus]|uniref:Mid2 domain-containing protein n=1 Tax=Aspergillus pseudoustus TaxID=1810923 RepID=A0ABR4JBQ9_9EURO
MDACYSMHKGIISKNVAVIPCGVTNTTNPHVTCCVRGDWCMSDSICHFNNTEGESGYYRADCTDPTLTDPACATRCGSRKLSDIRYNSSSGFWGCCNYDANGTVDCDGPSTEIFPGPDPADLVQLQYLPEEGTPTYAVAAASATSVNSSTVSASGEGENSSGSSSVSFGAAVGGGVGAGLGLFFILIAVFWLVRRRRRAGGEAEKGAVYVKEEEEPPRPVSQRMIYELGKTSRIPEPGELEGDYDRRF